MPHDPFEFEIEEEEAKKAPPANARRKFDDFDCPTCNANNPRDEIFGDGDEVMCFYCGSEFRARVNEEGRLRLKEL